MSLEELGDQLAATASRRTVVKTGVKLAYAAPLVAATMKLSSGGALALSGVCANAVEGCTGADGCGGDCAGGPSNNGCKVSVEGVKACVGGGGCARLCNATSECPPGYICSVSCCGTECVPICGEAADAGVAAAGSFR